MIRFEDVSHRTADGSSWSLRDLSFELHPGEVGAFHGANGAGKSLLLRIAATLESPSLGSVTVLGEPTRARAEKVRTRIGYLPASLPPPRGTVRERLDRHAEAYRVAPSVVDDVLELTELEALASRALSTLSDGERRRAELARVLLHDPDVLLLDDPDRGMTRDARRELAGFLAEMATLGKTIAFASHDEALARDADALCWTLASGSFTATPERDAAPSRTTEGSP